jgi:hypothetical protein
MSTSGLMDLNDVRLGQLIADLEAGRLPSLDVIEWLTDGVRRYEQDGGCTLDAALGLAAPGHSHYSTRRAWAERDRFLRLAAMIEPDVQQLALKFRRYGTDEWKRPGGGDRLLDHWPEDRTDKLKEFFWRSLKAVDRIIDERRLRQIVHGSSWR